MLHLRHTPLADYTEKKMDEMFKLNIKIAEKFSVDEHAVLFQGSCLYLLRDILDKSMQLILTNKIY